MILNAVDISSGVASFFLFMLCYYLSERSEQISSLADRDRQLLRERLEEESKNPAKRAQVIDEKIERIKYN